MKGRWVHKPLGEVCEVIGGGTPSKSRPDFYGGTIPWATVRDMKSDTIESTEFSITEDAVASSTTNIIPRGNVVIATRVGLGKVCILARDTAINQDLRGVIPKSNEIVGRFLYYWFRWAAPRIVEEGTGATVQGVKLPFIKSLPFPVLPQEEQERIVAILDEAFEGIAVAEANAIKARANAFELFESHAVAIFAVRGDGWGQRKLGDVCRKITVGHVGPMMSEYRSEGIPFLRSQNVRPFQISLENVTYIDPDFNSALKKSELLPGDLAIVRTGYPGTAAVIPHDLPISNCSDLVIVRPGPDLNPFYMAHFFNSAHGKLLVLGNLVGSAQKHFNIGTAKNVMVPIPSVAQQREIVSKLDELRAETQRVEAAQSQKLRVLDELKQSLLHQAFSGNL